MNLSFLIGVTLREELARDWMPRNGIEQLLIDTMAQALTGMYLNLEWLFDRGCIDDWTGPMAERFHRMFLRTLRLFCDLRKVPLAVIVQNAGQVNVGGQQVNVAA